MTSKETLCSGCGATVTQWVDGIWRDETESGYCSESTTLHHPSVLPPVAMAEDRVKLSCGCYSDEPHMLSCSTLCLMPVAIAPEPQHTPKPWEVREGGNFIVIGFHGYCKWADENHYGGGLLAIAEMEYPVGATEEKHQEILNRARFIVRACNSHDDMLDALKAAQLELLQSRPSEYSEEVLGIIDAAISRAEGGKQ